MNRIGGLLEGLLLLGMGVYMSGLCWVGDYGFFMNPKFKWLTAIAAVGLLLLGISLLIRPNRRPSLSNIVVFVFLMGLFAMELDAAIYPPSPEFANNNSETATPAEEEPQTLSYKDVDYIKINLAELNVMCETGRKERMAAPYVVRGVVKKGRMLERQGEFSLIRLTVFCCLADSIGMGIRVKIRRFRRSEGRNMDERIRKAGIGTAHAGNAVQRAEWKILHRPAGGLYPGRRPRGKNRPAGNGLYFRIQRRSALRLLIEG